MGLLPLSGSDLAALEQETSMDAMRDAERENHVQKGGAPNKVRHGKVCGFKDELSPETVAKVTERMRALLSVELNDSSKT